jgi:hypothetical protein
MIVIQIQVKQTAPNNVSMQACGGHVGVATDDEVKAADQIIVKLDALFRTVGNYTEIRPTTIITRDVPPDKTRDDSDPPTSN